MSYRTIKRLLGETSLERKCRFLFGGALLLLITGSFYVYAQLNLRIVRDQYRQRARLLIGQNLQYMHRNATAPTTGKGSETATQPSPESQHESAQNQSKEPAIGFKPKELAEDLWSYFPRNWSELSAEERPNDQFVFDLLERFPKFYTGEGDLASEVRSDPETDRYEYFEPIYARTDHEEGELSCYDCHKNRTPNLAEGELLGVGRIRFSLKETARSIARNSAVLIAMAIAIAFLAMLASYAIVRYVIVKPVQHLKEVSDSVAHGDLDQRADIRTGDEFEELSHAFNRMLRHLVNTQEELRHVNINLDAKVDELARANLSLHQMNKVKNEFLATMSHELRTPLNSILGFSDVLSSAENL